MLTNKIVARSTQDLFLAIFVFEFFTLIQQLEFCFCYYVRESVQCTQRKLHEFKYLIITSQFINLVFVRVLL